MAWWLSALAPTALCVRVVPRCVSPVCCWHSDWADDCASPLSVLSTSQLAEAEAEASLDDVDSLLHTWQQGQQDSEGVPDVAQQAKMLHSWRQLLEEREAALRVERKLSSNKWLPGHLAAWAEGVGPSRRSGKRGQEARAQARSDCSQAAKEAESADAETEADAEDEEFIFTWQRHTESLRRDAAALEAATALDGLTALASASAAAQAGAADSRGGVVSGDEDGTCIGIDLGTTNCAVAAVINGEPRLLPVSDAAGGSGGNGVFPSLISFTELDHKELQADKAKMEAARPNAPLVAPNAPAKVLVGEAARRRMLSNAPSTFSSSKRLIGRTASAEELRALAALEVPYRRSGSGDIVLPCPALRRAVSPVDIAAELVREMVESSTRFLGRPVSRAVVCVPAYFGQPERAATLTACKLAGIRRISLLREPEAAALGYALDEQRKAEAKAADQRAMASATRVEAKVEGSLHRVMVFDLGGGTFDVTIVDIGVGKNPVVEVVATAGDPRLGGNDWDAVIADWLEEEFLSQVGSRISIGGAGRRRLLDAAEEAKLALSIDQSVQVDVPNLYGPLGVNVTLSRRKFEALCRPLLLRLVPAILQVASTAGITLESDIGTLAKGNPSFAAERTRSWASAVAWRWQRAVDRASHNKEVARPVSRPISRILLVGGATRMPCIGRFLRRMTGLKVKPFLQPEQAVALGAAVQAEILGGEGIQLQVINPFFEDGVVTSARRVSRAREAAATKA